MGVANALHGQDFQAFLGGRKEVAFPGDIDNWWCRMLWLRRQFLASASPPWATHTNAVKVQTVFLSSCLDKTIFEALKCL